FSIIRWQSSGSLVNLRKDLTTGGPSVMLGTKCPSMTSTWTTVAPPSVAAWTCSARWAKSADRIEGASSINLGSKKDWPNVLWKFYHAYLSIFQQEMNLLLVAVELFEHVLHAAANLFPALLGVGPGRCRHGVRIEQSQCFLGILSRETFLPIPQIR